MNHKLSPDQLRRVCDPGRFSFQTTAELPEKSSIIGQPRGTRAIEFGIDIDSPGYNIYVLGEAGTGRATAIERFLLGTISTRDRFGLAIPQLKGAVLDIRFRMLQPQELARAMSFPDDYHFAGNREQKVKQIGNAVPVNLAKALCTALLE